MYSTVIMNKGLLIGVAAVVIIAVAGVGAYMTMGNKTQTPADNTSMMTDETNSMSDSKSFMDLLGLTSNQMCTFSDEKGSGGTVYTGGGKVRGDFTSDIDNTVTNTHVISDSQNVYLWFDGAEEGFKMPMTDIEKFQSSDTTTAKSLDVDKKVDYECNAWTVDTSKFTLPNMTFEDFGAMMQGVVENITRDEENTDTSAQCSACNNLPAESQAQCLQLLNCN